MSNFEVVLMEFELPEISNNMSQQMMLVFELYVPKKLCAYGADKSGCSLKRSERRPFVTLVLAELNQLKQTLNRETVRPLVAIEKHVQWLGESTENYLLSRSIELGNIIISGMFFLQENEEILQRHKTAIIEKVNADYDLDYFDMSKKY